MKKNQNPKISIIVTVYNSTPNLPKCLDSLIYQTYENMEIICINDSSAEIQQEILREYKTKDSRIKVFESSNNGPGAARNYGITVATGEYISFVDSDDWVLLTLYKSFADSNSEKNVDIFNFNAESYLEKTDETFTKKLFNLKIWDKHDSDETIHTFDDCNNPFCGNLGVCNKIYNLHFLRKNNIKFMENVFFEDRLFHVETFIKAKSILVTNQTFYRYRESSPSPLMGTTGENIFDIFVILTKIEELIRENGLYEELKYALLQYKYEEMNNLFKKTRFSLKSKFFEKMQECIKEVNISDFDVSICEQLTNFHLYNDILNNNWTEFTLGKRFSDAKEE